MSKGRLWCIVVEILSAVGSPQQRAGRRTELAACRSGSSDPEAWPGSRSPDSVVRIGELTLLERQAAAPDALRQPELQPFQFLDAFGHPAGPAGGQPGPVGTLGHAVLRQLGELLGDLLERQADLLCEDDERDAPEHRPRIAAVAGAGAFGGDQAARLVEPQGRRGDAAAAGDYSDREELGGGTHRRALDLKLTLTCRLLDVEAFRHRGGCMAATALDTLRVAITGGTSGLGLALVRQLRDRGAHVAFVARDPTGVD